MIYIEALRLGTDKSPVNGKLFAFYLEAAIFFAFVLLESLIGREDNYFIEKGFMGNLQYKNGLLGSLEIEFWKPIIVLIILYFNRMLFLNLLDSGEKPIKRSIEIVHELNRCDIFFFFILGAFSGSR